MSIPTRRTESNTPFLKALGALAISSVRLREVQAEIEAGTGDTVNRQNWLDYAATLVQSRESVLVAAASSSFSGNTLTIEVEAGVHMAIETTYIDKLCRKMDRHIILAAALGLAGDEPAVTTAPISTRYATAS